MKTGTIFVNQQVAQKVVLSARITINLTANSVHKFYDFHLFNEYPFET
jgi:hypothetical protein